MRNPRPFKADELVGLQAVVEFVHVVVFAFQQIGGQRLVAFRMFMDFQLEFREHRLAVDGQADFIGQMTEQICPNIFVFRFGEQIFGEQDFIRRGGDLRHENLVAMIMVWLVFARIV